MAFAHGMTATGSGANRGALEVAAFGAEAEHDVETVLGAGATATDNLGRAARVDLSRSRGDRKSVV